MRNENNQKIYKPYRLILKKSGDRMVAITVKEAKQRMIAIFIFTLVTLALTLYGLKISQEYPIIGKAIMYPTAVIGLIATWNHARLRWYIDRGRFSILDEYKE